MTKFQIKESFEWMAAPEFQVVNTGKNKVTIRGVAVKKGQISRNKRKYVDEELKMAARTWIGKPVTINHAPWNKTHPMYDSHKVAGNVRWMEYNKGALEYQIDINKQPYVDMFRNKSVQVQGVSIEADYIYNRCSHCGKQFYTQEEFEHHMVNEEFIKNFNYEPHQMLGRAVSVVLSPEEPGVQGTTIDLMEKYQRPKFKGFSQLLETVITTKKETSKYMTAIKGKAAISPQQRITMHKAKKMMEQEEPPTPPCPEGYHEVEGKCVKDEPVAEQEAPSPPCPDGWHEVEGKCVKDVTEQEEPPSPPCPEGWHEVEGKCVKDLQEQEEAPSPPCPEGWHEADGKCVKDTVTEQEEGHVVSPEPETTAGEEPTLEPKCPEGFHREGEDCVVDAPPAAELELPAAPMPVIPAETPPSPAPVPPGTTATAEIVSPKVTLPKLLKLGEPFASYTDFADCVAKNPDKEDPEAFCASIKQKVEGESVKETATPKDVYEALAHVKTLSRDLHTLNYQRTVVLAECSNKLTRAVAEIVNTYPKLAESTQKTVAQINKKFAESHAEAKRTHEYLGKLGTSIKGLREFYNEKLGQLATAQSNKTVATKKKLSELATATGKIASEIKATTKLATQQKEEFEKILDEADTNMLEAKKTIKTLEDWKKLKEQEDAKQPEPCPEGEHRDETDKCVKNEPSPEAEETKKKIAEMAVKIDNLEAKQKGQFKGKSQTVKPVVKEHPEDPNKAKGRK